MKFKKGDYFYYESCGGWMLGQVTRISIFSGYHHVFYYHILENGNDQLCLTSDSGFSCNSPMYNRAKKLEDGSKASLLAVRL